LHGKSVVIFDRGLREPFTVYWNKTAKEDVWGVLALILRLYMRQMLRTNGETKQLTF
jgi:hypothetical protein